MLRHIKSGSMGHSNLHWLDSYHHFSFSQYYNPENIQFGVLRVLNDDIVGPGTGFDTHPHANMEILSYVVDGELTHADSMGNRHTLHRGQVQYMSAGTGVEHSEHNLGHELLRFLQIWIFPDQKDYQPQYGEHRFKWEDRINRWMPIASGDGDPAFPIQIHADVHAYATLIPREESITFAVEKGRQAYLVAVEGFAEVNGIPMEARDAIEITEETVHIRAEETTHLLLLEMKKAD